MGLIGSAGDARRTEKYATQKLIADVVGNGYRQIIKLILPVITKNRVLTKSNGI